MALFPILTAIICASFVEWFVHGPVMHGYLGSLKKLHEGHKQHHAWFSKGQGYRNLEHGDSVALPVWTGLLLVLIMSIVGTVAGQLLRLSSFKWFFGTTSLLYYIAYEYLHTAIHIPKERFIEKTKWFQNKLSYHKVHHTADEKFGILKNICILCDIADHVMRTKKVSHNAN